MLAIRTPYSSTCTDALAGLGRARPVLPSPILRTDSAEAWWVLAAERGGREDAVELPGGGVRVRNERAREPRRPSEQREPARLHDLGHAGVRARRDRTEPAQRRRALCGPRSSTRGLLDARCECFDRTRGYQQDGAPLGACGRHSLDLGIPQAQEGERSSSLLVTSELTLQLGPRFLDPLCVAFRDGPKLHRREGELPAFPDSAHHHFPTSRSQDS